jgi:hypothetical protein
MFKILIGLLITILNFIHILTQDEAGKFIISILNFKLNLGPILIDKVSMLNTNGDANFFVKSGVDGHALIILNGNNLKVNF